MQHTLGHATREDTNINMVAGMAREWLMSLVQFVYRKTDVLPPQKEERSLKEKKVNVEPVWPSGKALGW